MQNVCMINVHCSNDVKTIKQSDRGDAKYPNDKSNTYVVRIILVFTPRNGTRPRSVRIEEQRFVVG